MKVVVLVSLVLAAAVALPLENEKQPDPRIVRFVSTESGQVMGTSLTFTIPGARQVFSFYGIPYGKDTSGTNRFKKPQPVDSWAPETYDASDWDDLKPVSCIQEDPTNPGNTQGTEDCLRLHIYSPELGDDVNNPVMIFLHGGGFTAGDGQLYTQLKLLNRDVVLVVIQYRLGIFGFLTTDTEDAPGNAGLYDQRLGMQWVKNNIANFGGDPDRITIWGESAGASSVGLHIVSSGSNGLYNQAIMQSGAALSAWSVEENPLEYHKTFGPYVGCAWDASNPSTYLNCLYNKDATELLVAQKNIQYAERLAGRHGFRGVSPVLEKVGGTDRFLYEDPILTLAQGRFNNVPVLLGANKHEGSYPLGLFYLQYMAPNNYQNNTNYLKYEIMNFFMEVLEIVDETSVIQAAMDHQYLRDSPRETFNDVMPSLMDFIGATLLKAGAYSTALFMSLHDSPTYFYSFEYSGNETFFDIFFPFPMPIPNGVCHGDELMYMFAYPPQMTDDDAAVSEKILDAWTNFAAVGNPDPVHNQWPQFSRSDPRFMRIKADLEVGTNYYLDFTAAVDDLESGIPIPDSTPDAARRLHTRERFLRSLGKNGWTSEDEEAVLAAVSKGGSKQAHDMTFVL